MLVPTLLRVACAAALLASQLSWAMDFRLVGHTLVMSGPVVSDDLARLKDQLATGQVKLILLHESKGGDLWNGLRLAERIRNSGLPTAVSGTCQSSCGLIFLGGTERSFSDGRPLPKTMVGLHGAHHIETKQAMPEVGAQIAHLILTMTARRYPEDLLHRTVYGKDPDDFIFVLHPRRFRNVGKPQGVLECLKQPDGRFECKAIDGLDAMSIGVVTNPDILRLEQEVKEFLARLDQP